MASRIVIAGAGGQVGSFLAAEATRRGREVAAFTSSQWDVCDPRRAAEIVRSGDVVVNCAAYTAVDDAERDRDRAHAVNASAPEHIAQACAHVGARLVHLSTDYVFDGSASRPYEPSDPTGPLSVYGRTKLDGEQAALNALTGAVVVRTAWVYTGAHGKDFVAAMRRLAAGDGIVDMVDDQTGSPTFTGDLVDALFHVVDGGVRPPEGIVHAANAGEVTRCGQARAVFEMLGADPQRVRPVSSADNPRPAPRPVYSALSGRQSQQAGLSPLRPWRDALAHALGVPS